jgi:hypothetical protein
MQKFAVNDSTVRNSVKELLHDLLLVEAEGDYDSARNFIEKYDKMPDNMKNVNLKLKHVPVDIRPVFEVLEEL